VEFYVCTLEALAAEEVARRAFDRFDVDGSNSLEKHELFQALFELDMVPGHDAYEKRVYLEDQFAIADVNGDGVVDFAEFVAFYTSALHDSRKSDEIFERRRKTRLAREARARRADSYVKPNQLFQTMQSGELALLSAHWLLERAGYERSEVERRGTKKSSWSMAGALTPLSHRAALEASHPEAFISHEAMQASYDGFDRVCTFGGKAFETTEIGAVPFILASHSWETPTHADPAGRTLAVIAKNLARQMPTFQAWGFDDVGVFFDFSCMYQTIDGEVERTPMQDSLHRKATHHVGVWFAHRLTTVWVVDNESAVTLPRAERGRAFFEEALCRLFKETPPSKPFKVKGGALVPAWPKLIALSHPDVQGDENGVNPQAGAPKQMPPLSAPHFIERCRKLAFAGGEAERTHAEHHYRAAVEDGYNSLNRLAYSRCDWTDDDVKELASTLCEIPCPNVTELDLSWNDMREGSGLEAIGRAIALGALHSLQVLNLINCTAIKTLPESLEELLELHTIMLDGCVQLKTLPSGIGKLASLKIFSIVNCHYLVDDALKHLPSSAKIIRVRE